MNDRDFINVFAHTDNVAANEAHAIIEDIGKWAEEQGMTDLADAMYRLSYLVDQALDDQIDIHEHREKITGWIKQAEEMGYQNGMHHD